MLYGTIAYSWLEFPAHELVVLHAQLCKISLGSLPSVLSPHIMAGVVSIQTGIDATNGYILQTLAKCSVVDNMDIPGRVKPPELPIRDDIDRVTFLKNFFDLHEEVDWTPGIQDVVTKCCKEGRLADLPEPFCLRKSPECNYMLQLAVVKRNDGKHCLIKQILTSEKMSKEYIKQMCHQPHAVQWGDTHPKTFARGLQWLFQEMEGWQARCFVLEPKVLSHGWW